MRTAVVPSSLSATLVLAALAGCAGEPTGPDVKTDAPLAATASAPLSFAQLSVGYFHTCGVTTGGKAYCWGANDWGQLGDGHPIINVSIPRPLAGAGGPTLRHLSARYPHNFRVTTDGPVFC